MAESGINQLLDYLKFRSWELTGRRVGKIVCACVSAWAPLARDFAHAAGPRDAVPTLQRHRSAVRPEARGGGTMDGIGGTAGAGVTACGASGGAGGPAFGGAALASG